MQIDHLAIWTKDLEKIREFYIKYFNCISNSKYSNVTKQFSSYFLSFSNGFRIELMHQPDIINASCTNCIGLAHFAINVGTKEKVDSLTQILKKDGFTIKSEPRTTGDGYYESVILDPENNLIELTAISDYAIIPALVNDLSSILQLQKYCYLSEAEIIKEYNIQPLTQTMSEIELEFSNQLFLKLVYRNRIIGSVRAYEKDGTCFIGKLIVDRSFQNMGFGKMLMAAIEEKFEHVQRFELFTGTKSDRNLFLYKKLGYIPFKTENRGNYQFVFLEKFVSNS